MAEIRYHRLRYYEGRYSNFDLIERCGKPSFCVGCEFKHPFCSEQGRVATPAAIGGENE